MSLIPLLLLNKEAYPGLPLWSCTVFSFLLPALQLSEAFPTVHRQSHFTEKTHKEWTPLLNNITSNNKDSLRHVSSDAFICSHRHGSAKLHTHLSIHNTPRKEKMHTDNYVLAAPSTLSLMHINNFTTHTAHKDQFTLYRDLLPVSLSTTHTQAIQNKPTHTTY